MLYFAVYTINNLPLLFEVVVPDSRENLKVSMKYPVPQLKPLLEESVRYVLTRSS